MSIGLRYPSGSKLASPVRHGSLRNRAISELVSIRAQGVRSNSQTSAVGLYGKVPGSANLSSGTSLPLTTSRPNPSVVQSFPSAPSNFRLRASTCASSVKRFHLAREHLQLAITPCSFDGEAGSLGVQRAGPCGRAGRACRRGFLARSQAFFACDRC
jgi:hypothetical protein